MTPTRSRPAIRFALPVSPYLALERSSEANTKPAAVSTRGAAEHARRFHYALLGTAERILVLDRDRADTGVPADRRDELPPPGRVAPATGDREVPRQRLRIFRPAMVEQAEASEVGIAELDILAVAVRRPIADVSDDGDGVHAHPEEVAGIDVGRKRVAQRGEAIEGLHVVDGGARVQLETDQ